MKKLSIIMFLMLTVFVSRALASELAQPLGTPAPSSPEYEKYIKQKSMLEEKKKKIEAELQRIASEDVAYMKTMMEADRERDMWKEIEKHIISVEKKEPLVEVRGAFRTMKYKKLQENPDGSYYYLTKTYQIDSNSEVCQSFVRGLVDIGAGACYGIHSLDLNAEALVKYATPFPDNTKTPLEFIEYIIGARLYPAQGYYAIERTYDYYFAELAGLKPGDLILTIDNIPVTKASFDMGLERYIRFVAGNRVKITVRRGDKEITVYRNMIGSYI